MDVEQLASRAKAVSCVYIATEFVVVIQTPVVPICSPEFFQVMDVRSFYVKHFAEQALLSHVQCCQFEEVVNAIFQLHAMLASSLRSVDKCPDFFQCHSRWNFDSYVLALFHGINTHLSMVLPVGCNVYKVDVVTLAKLLPSFFVACVSGCFRKTGFGQDVLAFFYILRYKVAQSYDLCSRNVCKARNGSRTTHAQTDESYTDCFEFWSGELDNILLSGRTFRYFNLNRCIALLFACTWRSTSNHAQ